MDLITLEVIQQFFIATVREMRATMIKTAHSSIIYEGHDFSCALLDGNAQLVAQSEDSPAHVIPLPRQVAQARALFGDSIAPGDVILVNDPYTSGTHLNDVAMIVPFFANDELTAFLVARAHWGDVGGMCPGSISGRATEIFQEGLRIPLLRVHRRGEPVPGILDLVFANVRGPEDREGDFHAMLASCHTAEVRLADLVRRFGAGTVRSGMEALLDRAERRMRLAIGRLVPGTYLYEDYLDSDNVTGRAVLLRVAVTAAYDTLTVDFGGSAAQVRGPVNCSLAVTATGTFVAVKALLDPYAPINHGAFRPVTVLGPDGSITNARYPAPTGGFSEMRRRIESVVMGALAPAAPAFVAGDNKGASNHTYISSEHPRRRRLTIFYEYPSGGTGAFLEHDGSHAMRAYDEGDFSSIQPVEAVEHEHALLVERCELRVDSCGHGLHRGGLGLRREVRLLADEGSFSELSDRNIVPPYGVCGGHAGAANRFVVRRDGVELQPSDVPGKVSGFRLLRDDIVIMESAGGGGYGDPLKRDVVLVARDVEEGYLTVERAETIYGAVFGDARIDAAATARRREAREASSPRLVVRSEEHDRFRDGQRVCAIANETAEELRLGEGDLVEYLNPRGAPLRAWIVVANEVPVGYAPLGPIGRAILQVQEEDEVRVRRLGRASSVLR